MPTTFPADKKPCAVCGGPNARYNYGSLTCVSCKSFFIRATLVVFPYECQQSGKCSIVASSPDYCKGCRYKGCLKAGMNPHLVGRRPRFFDAVGPITNRQQLLQRHVTPMLSLGFRFAAYATGNIGPIQFAKHFCNVDRISLRSAAEDQVNYYNMNVSLVDVFLNSSLCYSPDEVLVVSEKDLIRCIFAHGYCKYLVAFVDFASAVPELRLLSTADTMKLLQNNRNEVAMLRAFYFHHLMPDREEKQKQCIEQLEFISREQGAIWKHFYNFYDEQVADVFDEICMTAEEMVLLRLVAMFSSFQDCSEEGLDVLRKSRGKYTNILIEYQNQVYSQMSPYAKIKRLQTMLRFLTVLKEFAEGMHSRYTRLVLNNVDDLLGPLSYDLQVRFYRD